MFTAKPLSVFHICSDYARQSLYPELLRSLSAIGVRQFMYVPVRTTMELGVGQIADDRNIMFRFQHILRYYHKLFFRSKVRKILGDIVESTPVANYQCIHAHFLYSDGAVALALHRRFGVPYIVAVRNSDVNAFMRLRPDLVLIRNAVLRHASRVVFLSPAYAEHVLGALKPTLGKIVSAKTIIVPNGISAGWLKEVSQIKEIDCIPGSILRLLYVGDFTPNKNVAGIISAFQLLQAERPTTLTIVGGGGDKGGHIQALLDRYASSGVTYLGKVLDRALLQSIYRTHDVFLMPSFHETFGRSYIEALSQGVPVVHSQGQAIDGYFEDGTVAAAVDPRSASSIAAGVREVALRLPAIRQTCREQASRFEWSAIGETYRQVYYSILGDLS
jgi:glycosyltransferase involved in cell wall biosynthesis